MIGVVILALTSRSPARRESLYLTMWDGIGPGNHGGGEHADLFLPPDTPTDPSPEVQFQTVVDVFHAYRNDEPAGEPTWVITYYTPGQGAWKMTSAH